jgi:hypothetical protein
MKFFSKRLWLAKDPDNSGEYQDAVSFDTQRGMAAIADGVSSAIFSRRWAEILTERCVADPPNVEDREAFVRWLFEPRRAWAASIDPSKLAWHQRSKLKNGAFATLLAASFSTIEKPHLSAWAIGDCNLFHVRAGELLLSFPIRDSLQFGIDPLVIGSIDANRDSLLEFARIDLEFEASDLFVLSTDAIASWALAEYEAGRSVDWNEFRKMSDESFASRIVELRKQGAMRVDDATLLLLTVEY